MFGARDELKGQLVGQLAPKAEQRLVAILLHPARPFGIGNLDEIVRCGVERVEPRDIIQRVERRRSEEHTSELQSLMRISYAVFCLKKKTNATQLTNTITTTNPITATLWYEE